MQSSSSLHQSATSELDETHINASPDHCSNHVIRRCALHHPAVAQTPRLRLALQACTAPSSPTVTAHAQHKPCAQMHVDAGHHQRRRLQPRLPLLAPHRAPASRTKSFCQDRKDQAGTAELIGRAQGRLVQERVLRGDARQQEQRTDLVRGVG